MGINNRDIYSRHVCIGPWRNKCVQNMAYYVDDTATYLSSGRSNIEPSSGVYVFMNDLKNIKIFKNKNS